MTGGTTPRDEPYHESVDYSWTEKAFEMLEHGDLHGEVASRDAVISSRVWGPCPRCGHVLDDPQTHTAVTNLMGGEWHGKGGVGPDQSGDTSPVFVPVDVSCGCGQSHPGAPAGTTGCGVSFRVELPLRLTGSSGQP
jgi:hypothetical protein